MEDKGLRSDSSIPKKNLRDIGRIKVTGYDRGLPQDYVENVLRKHFSSCGEITDVYVPEDDVPNTLMRFGYIYFMGESSVEKALQLNGSEVEGGCDWELVAKSYPFVESVSADFFVRGFDRSLSDDHIKKVLTEHFSSCGEIEVDVLRPKTTKDCGAIISIDGEDVEDKGREHSVIDIGGGITLVANLISVPAKTAVHYRPRYTRSFHNYAKQQEEKLEGSKGIQKEERLSLGVRPCQQKGQSSKKAKLNSE